MLLLHIFLTLFLGLLPGLLWMWIIFETKFKGILLWIFSWLIGWAYIAFGLYIIQFIHHGIGWIERFFLLLIPTVIISIMFFTKKISFLVLKETLFLKNSVLEIKKSYKDLSPVLRVILWLLFIYIAWYIVLTFTHNIFFPSYHMDSLLRLNEPALSIVKNNGFYFSDYTKVFYPFFVAIYKSLIVIIIGNRNENLINIYQWIVFFVMSLFVVTISWKKTTNVVKSILPLALIYSLPLVYFEVVDGYLDLTMIIYALITIWAWYIYLEKKDFSYLLLGWIFCCIQAFIKDDGFFVYIPVLLFSFTLFLLIKKRFRTTLSNYFSSWKISIWTIIMPLYFIVPYFLFKHLKQGVVFERALSIGKNYVHTEVLNIFPNIFFQINNYNIILVPIVLGIIYIFYKKLYKTNILFIIIVPIILFFHLLITVFILSDNYLWALNQTAINRAFTTVFLLILAFSSFYIGKRYNKE